METCDVLIVGGGPAGSSCAWKLRQHGMSVVVIDKAPFPRDKICAGWITPAVVQALQLDTGGYAEGRVLQPITAIRTGLIRGGELETRYPATISFGIRRCEFDHYLLQRSAARLRLGETLKSLEKRGSLWTVNDAIAAPLLIGAGGHFCPVARFLGAKLGAAEDAVAAKEIEFAMDAEQAAGCRVRADTPEIYFCRDLNGYGWCFRKGNYLNIGLGREGHQGLAEHLADFCDFLKQRGKIAGNIPDKFHGHAYLVRGHSGRKLLDEGVLLVGDAAGLAYAQSGEGIRPAVESGLIAAAVVADAGEDYRHQRLQVYAERLRARFGPEVAPAANMIPGFLRNVLARGLLGSRWATRHVVLDRWFLHTQQPALNLQ
jgi:geranylgeranyl reductase family protein